jgi:site-specific DNA-cytosine methylase
MTYVDITEEPQRIISFCTGIRGLERGLERINPNIRTMCYVEVEAFIIQNLVAQMEKGLLAPAPVWADARTFPAHIFRNKVDGIIGGYPCQGESIAGLRELENYPGYLWPALRSAIRTIKPVWCYFENVDDHLSGTFRYVLSDLREMGYTVEVGIYTAEEVGAPHERQRVFIFAVENTVSLRMRRWNGSGIDWGYEIQITGSGNMADTISGTRGISDSERRKQKPETVGSGEGLGYSQGIDKSGNRIQSGKSEVTPRRSGDKSESLDDTSCNGSESEHTISTGRNGTIVASETVLADSTKQRLEESGRTESGQSSKAGETVADSIHNGKSQRPGQIRGKEKKAEGTEHREKWDEIQRERGGTESEFSGEDVAKSQDIGRERFQRAIIGDIGETEGTRTGSWFNGNHPAFGRYPARPGQPQYEWEEPRTIKSGMGCTVNGYKYREDFLRALGNSVLEDVAVYSFIDLYIKHILNGERISK